MVAHLGGVRLEHWTAMLDRCHLLARVLAATTAASGVPGCVAQETDYERLNIDYETPRVRIGLEHGVLCGGDLERLDAYVLELERSFGGVGDAKHTIYVYEQDPPQCRDAVRGCYIPEIDAVATTWPGARHELVHSAFAHRFGGFAERFWSEGIADAMSGPTIDQFRDAAPMIASQPAVDNAGYATAGHMTNWIIRQKGGLPVATRLALGVPPALVFGEGAVPLAQEYQREAAYAYPSVIPDCPGLAPAAPASGDGRWAETIDVDCDSVDVSAYSTLGRLSVRRHLRVTQGSTYSIRVEGDAWFLAYGCIAEALDAPVDALDDGDIPFEREPWFLGVSSMAIVRGEERRLRAGFDGLVMIILEAELEGDRIGYEIAEMEL